MNVQHLPFMFIGRRFWGCKSPLRQLGFELSCFVCLGHLHSFDLTFFMPIGHTYKLGFIFWYYICMNSMV